MLLLLEGWYSYNSLDEIMLQKSIKGINLCDAVFILFCAMIYRIEVWCFKGNDIES